MTLGLHVAKNIVGTASIVSLPLRGLIYATHHLKREAHTRRLTHSELVGVTNCTPGGTRFTVSTTPLPIILSSRVGHNNGG